MKTLSRLFLPAAAGILLSLHAFPQTGGEHGFLTGSWLGKLKVQSLELTFILNFSFNEKDSLTVTIDSPDQGAKDLPTSKVSFREDSVLVYSRKLNGVYKARILKDEGRMEGTWAQGPYSFPLTVIHQEKPYAVNRPQEPKPPFPYLTEEVSIPNAQGGNTLSGTLTIPEGTGPFPAAVLITGSGPQDRNEEIFQHKPFLLLADWLTRHGILVLRYDDRGIGKSTGNFSSGTTFDFATDALAAFYYLKTRKEADTGKIGLIGHSEGAIIASLNAASNKEIGFIVLMAGTAVPGDKLLLEQTALIGKASGMNDREIAEAQKLNGRIYSVLKKEKDTGKAEKKILAILQKSNREQQKKGDTVASEKELEMQAKTLVAPWLRTFVALNPFLYLEKVSCPVLALDGELDLQVPPKENLEAIERALIFAGNSHYETVLFPKLNHLFQTATTGSPDEYGKIEETIAPAVLEKISDWILSEIK